MELLSSSASLILPFPSIPVLAVLRRKITKGRIEVSLSPWGPKTIGVHSSKLGNFGEEGTQTLMVLLDTGAQVTILPVSLGRRLLNSTNKVWAGFPVGKINLKWSCGWRPLDQFNVLFLWFPMYIPYRMCIGIDVLHVCAVNAHNIQRGFSWSRRVTCREVMRHVLGHLHVAGIFTSSGTC